MRVPPISREDSGSHFDPAGLSLIALFWQWRYFFVLNTLLVMIAAAVVALTMPNVYRATATLLPPQGDRASLSAKLIDNVGSFGPIGFAAGRGASTADLLAAILRSRRLADLVVSKQDLMTHYSTATLPAARRRFNSALAVTLDADGLIKVRYADRDPELAAAVVNAALAGLDSINQSLSAGVASATREFVEARLVDVSDRLRRAEDSLRTFQETTGTIAMEEQLNIIIKNLALLRVERMKLEMQLAIQEDRLGSDHRRTVATEESIRTLDHQIRAAENAGDSAATLTAGNAPLLYLQSLRLLRQVTVFEQLYQFLRQALEQAKIDERRDLPTFTVLDPAVPPDQKWKPRRTFVVLGSGLTTLAVLALLVVWTESRRMQSETPAVGYVSGWRRLVGRRRETVN